MWATLIPVLLPFIMKALEKILPDQDARDQAQKDITMALVENQGALNNAMKDVMVADSQSGDPYTSRARPTIVYWSLTVVSLIMVFSILGFADPLLNALNSIPGKMWDLITVGIGAYVLCRSGEKMMENWKK